MPFGEAGGMPCTTRSGLSMMVQGSHIASFRCYTAVWSHPE
jgi:hypothetical protein